MDIWDFIVEVFVPNHDRDGGAIGTGYPVTDGLILTAGHVLQGGKSADVRWRFGPPSNWKWYEGVEVAWDGSRQDIDAALLRMEFPSEVADWCPVLDEVIDKRNWDSRGFPAVGERGRARRMPTPPPHLPGERRRRTPAGRAVVAHRYRPAARAGPLALRPPRGSVNGCRSACR